MTLATANPFVRMAANLRDIADRLEARSPESPELPDDNRALEQYLLGSDAAHQIPDTKAVSAAVYEMYRARNKIFAEYHIFSDPAWNILLSIHAAMLSNKLPSIKAATATAGCPPVTGMRWVRVLESKGLVVRQDDTADKRQTLLSLTPVAFDLVERALARIGELCLRCANTVNAS